MDERSSRVLKYDICFVALHYKTAEETTNCFNSLMKLNGFEHMAVVMVDNSYAISDKSGKRVFEKFRRNENFYYIPNTDNTFFSFGNNMGYRFAKSFHPDFIVVTNSDTVFRQRDFKKRLYNLEHRNRFDLLGPDIVKYGVWEHQNPHYPMRLFV